MGIQTEYSKRKNLLRSDLEEKCFQEVNIVNHKALRYLALFLLSIEASHLAQKYFLFDPKVNASRRKIIPLNQI